MSRLAGAASAFDKFFPKRTHCADNEAIGSESLHPLPVVLIPPIPISTRPIPFAVRTVLAPMINQCDVPFRRLCASLGADVVYTQMLLAVDVVRDLKSSGLRGIVAAHFSSAGDRTPLVAQIAGDDPDVMAAAALALSPFCAAIDINLGCPQETAKSGHFGGWLCK